MLWAHQVANGSVSQGLNRHDSKAQITNPLAVRSSGRFMHLCPISQSPTRVCGHPLALLTKVNLHKKFLVGVGLPLFHQSLGKSGRPLVLRGGGLGPDLSAC